MFCDSVTVSSCLSVCRDYPMLWFNIAIAVGTIGSALVAVLLSLKKVLARVLFPVQLDIVKQKDNVLRYEKNPNSNNSVSSAYFYLKCISNKRENGVCVFLNKFEKNINGVYKGDEYPVPLPFSWAGIAENEKRPIIYDELVFNFGKIVDGETMFKPLLNIEPKGFNDYLSPGETARYTLIVSSEHTKPKKKIVEVCFSTVQNTSDFKSLSNAISIKVEDA